MNNYFTKWFLICVWDKYANFNGRARRAEYWMYILVCAILGFIANFIEGFLNLKLALLSGILTLVLFIPSFAVAIRRLHDVGKSGLWLFIVFVPIIGILYLLYLLIKDSQPETNQWGVNPKNDNMQIR